MRDFGDFPESRKLTEQKDPTAWGQALAALAGLSCATALIRKPQGLGAVGPVCPFLSA